MRVTVTVDIDESSTVEPVVTVKAGPTPEQRQALRDAWLSKGRKAKPKEAEREIT